MPTNALIGTPLERWGQWSKPLLLALLRDRGANEVERDEGRQAYIAMYGPLPPDLITA